MAENTGVGTPTLLPTLPAAFQPGASDGASAPIVSIAGSPSGNAFAQQTSMRTRAASSHSPPPLTNLRTGSVGKSHSPPPMVASVGALYGSNWGARSRHGTPQRYERDSLRSRSKEGRPGSRKHRRWTRSQELVSNLRREMAKCGEDVSNTDATDNAIANQDREVVPSVFFTLMEREGAGYALDALAAAEARRRSRPRAPRRKDNAQVAEERERNMRRAFSETWQFLQGNELARELIAQLEGSMACTFGPNAAANKVASVESEAASSEAVAAQCESAGAVEAGATAGLATYATSSAGKVAAVDANDHSEKQEQTLAKLWLLTWDGESLVTKDGKRGAACELVVAGLTPTQRKVVHTLVRVVGLVSESQAFEELVVGGSSWKAAKAAIVGGSDGRVLTIRPPRTGRPFGGAGTWSAPFSVANVLAVVAA